MYSMICNRCRVSFTLTFKSVKNNLRKYGAIQGQINPIEISPEEKIKEKRATTIIRCKNESLNFLAGQSYDKFKPVPLASKGWRHNKSIGDYFVIYPEGIPEDEVEISRDANQLKFDDSDLDKDLIKNLKEDGFIYPSEIQRLAIPALLTGKNSIIAAETGCGKTLAYMLPMIEQIIKWKTVAKRKANEPLGLILSPSRDLAQQLGIVAKKITRNIDVSVRTVVGGRTKREMMNPTVDDVDLLIGSFGAISKLTTTGILNMSAVRHVVLDEADTLLDDSFNEKLRYFLRKIRFAFSGPEMDDELPRSSQLTLVSATMPRFLPEVLENIINTDSLVRLTTEKLHKILPQVTQKFIRLNRSSKAGEILKIVKDNSSKRRQTLVFCNTVKTCEWLHLFLSEMGINCSFTHGSLPAAIRSDKFAEFQRGQIDVLATTDACSRGLDTVQVRHVVNFDFPLHTADYIHRCGRTGRLGSHEKCTVTNFICGPREVEILNEIETAVRTQLPLSNVNANITKIINTKIEGEINRTQRLIESNDSNTEGPKR